MKRVRASKVIEMIFCKKHGERQAVLVGSGGRFYKEDGKYHTYRIVGCPFTNCSTMKDVLTKRKV